MPTTKSEYISVLLRNGTDQLDRFDEGLKPESVKIHAFGIKEWMQFAYNFALKVNYFSLEDDQLPQATWENFFVEEDDLDELLGGIENPNGELKPHLTLFACFLKLIELSSNRLNDVTRRHLDFYYQDILNISKLPAKEDKAYVLFELAKNVSSYLVEKGVELDGDKDASGKKRIYKVAEELVASSTTVASIRNVYNEHNIFNEAGLDNENRYSITAASVANSLDGLGESLLPESPTWYPFGYYVDDQELTKDKTQLPYAKLGCAIASPVLKLMEGTRRVSFTFEFSQAITASITTAELTSNFQVSYTTDKKWSNPISLIDNDANGAHTEVVGSKLILSFLLDTDADPLEAYVKKFHAQQFVEGLPTVRLLLTTNTEAGYKIYSAFAGETNQLVKVTVDVHVKGMKSNVLESDTATLNSRKPFYPFTTNPVKGSSFTILNDEAFSKNWKKIKVNWSWKNTPDDFQNWYSAYESSLKQNISINNYLTVFDKYDFEETTGKYGLPIMRINKNKSNFSLIVNDDDYFTASILIHDKEVWGNAIKFNHSLFIKDDEKFTGMFELENDNVYVNGSADAVRLVLEKTFLHELYPRLYAVALSSEDKNTLIPNEPYTPFAENLTLEYEATEELNITTETETTFTALTSFLFHEHPFGQSQEHVYLRKKNSDASLVCRLFPNYGKGGELYVGLENAKVLDLISLYFKVAEGTENPLAKSFIGTQKIEWSILANNVWRSLDSTLMTGNEIDNMLTSGKVTFTIPDYATTENTLLDPGMFWIRAKMPNRYDAVCQLHGIHAQAIAATFDNRGNSLEHLGKGLPGGTIAKLINRVSQVKSIQQPYASFGGSPEETDQLYYRRVSERLRHKNRAITLWDYEHLVLQQFPEVYKVKCLNHTDETDFTAPGNVTLIVVPDTVNKTVFDIFQPRVSKGLLNKIGNYVSKLNSMHVNLFVINPNYEEVKIEVGAKFYPGLDENNYRKQLGEDLIRFLSPWAYERKAEVTFGISFTRSTIIHYMEQLDYVDYIDGLKIYKNDVLQGNHCMPSNPKSILVSAKEHLVLPVEAKCSKDNEQTPAETCQR